DLRYELIEKFKSLHDSYPLIRAIVRLTYINKVENTSEIFKNNQQFIKSCLEKDMLSSNSDRMEDAFYAAAECKQLAKKVFSIQKIIKTPIDHVRYLLDSETGYTLLFLQIWIEHNIIKKQNLKFLFEILSVLPQRIIDAKKISAELKSDILYYGGRLAGIISKTKFTDVDKTKLVENWQSFISSHAFPHDICNGYFKEINE
ncbi:MAG: hypothetical protein LUI04_05015, partial [Porphyromonadaceae bacterium]|nr:hypothetical protein [Porphyromonadaceae bacterium]